MINKILQITNNFQQHHSYQRWEKEITDFLLLTNGFDSVKFIEHDNWATTVIAKYKNKTMEITLTLS